MMRLRRPPLALALLALLALAACESDAERAERHFRSATTLLAEGDAARALVELRTALERDPTHVEARLALARTLRLTGAGAEAFAAFQRVIETAPDNLEARQALAEMAVEIGDWREARRQVDALRDFAPAAPATALLGTALDYRAARVARDETAAAAAARRAEAALAADPANLTARRIVVDRAMAGDDPASARSAIEAALGAHPGDYGFHQMRIALLAEMADAPALGAAIEAFAETFPDDPAGREMLLAWYREAGDLASTETYLRRLADAAGAPLVDKMTLVEFLAQTAGNTAVAAELERRIASDPDPLPFRARKAALDFDEGRRDPAMTDMRGLIAEAAADAGRAGLAADLRVALARMLALAGDADAARAEIAAALAAVPSHAAALKAHAEDRIARDDTAGAIQALRQAQESAPRDPEILILMGRAHERAGDRELAGERYALAVDASGRAPAESLLYATFLARENRIDVAAAVIEDALKRAPQDIGLMTALAELRLRQRDFAGAARLSAELARRPEPEAQAAAQGIEAERLLLQDRVDETLGFLEGLTDDERSGLAATARMVQIQVARGDVAAARTLIDAQLAERPDEPALLNLSAGLFILEGAPGKAEPVYRRLLEAEPAAEGPLKGLYGLLRAADRRAEAVTLLEATVAARPRAVLPRLLLAAEREAAEDIDGAIALYETLYAEDSNVLLVANNLASLLASHRDDAATLERAATIARRLRDSDVPAFQDTYGWIAYRRGDTAEALRYLQSAATGLPEDPLVHYHLGMTALALGQTEEARAALTRAVDLAGASTLAALQDARARLAALPPPPAEP
jgi:cellulose synthase operon protein C